ncbi:MAG: hypothetical protein JRD93_09105 [Deltaproteobacteria bacterium]|nr:hypothetical protein [Deltaproteobacteria bacterium]
MNKRNLNILVGILAIVEIILTIGNAMWQDPMYTGSSILVLFLILGSFVFSRSNRSIVRDLISMPDSVFNNNIVEVENDFLSKVAAFLESKEVINEQKSNFLARLDRFRHRDRADSVDFSDNFSQYCIKCAKMLKYSGDDICTVQTPHDVEGDHETAFEHYINKTVEKILEQNSDGSSVINLYKRLVIVDSAKVNVEIKKVRLFLERLFERGNQNEPHPSYNNIRICIVHRMFASQLFYSNLDVHITSPYNYSLAFQMPEQNGAFKWSSSVHINPKDVVQEVYANTNTLKSAFNILWNKGAGEQGEFDFTSVYNHQNSDRKDEQQKLLTDITAKMIEIVNRYP